VYRRLSWNSIRDGTREGRQLPRNKWLHRGRKEERKKRGKEERKKGGKEERRKGGKEERRKGREEERRKGGTREGYIPQRRTSFT
jgi:hypothetical protein